MPTLTAHEASDLFRRAPTEFLEVEAGAAAYWRVGQGPDVLFVHGWPVNGATWRALLPHLADHLTCHVVDLPGAGQSRFGDGPTPSVATHVRSVRRIVDLLDVPEIAVVGHDSGGLIARHAMAGDPRLRAMGLIDTEQPGALTLRFRSFLWARHAPGIGAALGWALGRRRLRRSGLLLGGAFMDRTLLDGEFDEFFLRPLCEDPELRRAAVQLLRSFDVQLVRDLPSVHQRIDVPVQLVWGQADPFFPVARARAMVAGFPDARLAEIAGAALFAHEEQPAAVAAALLPVLSGRG